MSKRTLTALTAVTLPAIAGCFGDSPATHSITIEVRDAVSGDPVSDATVELATYRQRDVALDNLHPATDDLEPWPYSDHQIVQTGGDGRAKVDVDVILAGGWVTLIYRYGYTNDRWVLRIQAQDAEEVLIIEGPDGGKGELSNQLQGLTNTGNNFKVEILSVPPATPWVPPDASTSARSSTGATL